MEETNPRTVAAHAAVLGLLAQGAHAARAELNTSADTAMEPGERFAARLAGRSLGRFLMPKDPVRVEITDWNALREWCERHRPEEVREVMVRQVSPTFVRWILELAQRDEDRRVVVDHNGTVIDGVTVLVGAAASTLTLDEDASATVARLLTDPKTRAAAAAVIEPVLGELLGMPGLRLAFPDEPQDGTDGGGQGNASSASASLIWDTPPSAPGPSPSWTSPTPAAAGGSGDQLEEDDWPESPW